MRTFTRLFSLLAAFILPLALLANVIVKGTVKYPNGQPVVNHQVYISTDSTLPSTTCPQTHMRLTNANGFYQDTLVCNNAIPLIKVYVVDCNGAVIIHTVQVNTATNVAESNFVICANNACHASFNWVRTGSNTTPATAIAFTSTATAGIATDSIISHTWNFGDGTNLTGNVANPVHTYTQPGIYVACLRIQTAGGCVSEICNTIGLSVNECRPEFNWEYIAGTINTIKFNSTQSIAGPADSIISRKWTFGDGDSLTGNVIAPTHAYANGGNYTVCLTTTTRNGCVKTVCKPITTLPAISCHAYFTQEILPASAATAARSVRFNSSSSQVGFADSIVSRFWKFGDGAVLAGNIVSPLHDYVQPGTYTVCLTIVSARGCRDSICKPLIIANPPLQCSAKFSFATNGLSVHFNSNISTAPANDSIVNRSWIYGDGTSAGNLIDPTHVYANAGVYSVCLKITTRNGCTNTWCATIGVNNVQGNCAAFFTSEQIASRTIRFNSTLSHGQTPTDSIVERKWEFGDNQILNGNIISPLHQYSAAGTYNVCLKIRTASGCENRWCKNVVVRNDSTPGTNANPIVIVNLYPVPVTTQLTAVVFSLNANVPAELSIYDVYGVRKFSRNVVLGQGNSTHIIPTAQLANGPYIFRVTTVYGVRNRNFYKLQ